MSERIAGVDELFRRIAQAARQAAKEELRAVFGPLTRGGKVLWSALPYPQAGADPTSGHVGAVQPDGTTITIDSATGIIHANAELPPGTKGDLLYFDGTVWARLPIASGNQGDFLMDDRANSGLPIWRPTSTTTPVGVGTTPPGTILIGSSMGAAKVLDLWNGSGNNAPPAGWTSPAFDDSAWAAATVLAGNPFSPGFPLVGGQGYLTVRSTGMPPAGSTNAQFAVRQHFTPPSPMPSTWFLTVSEDNDAIGLVNGTEVYAYNRPPTDPSPAHQVQFGGGTVRALDDNVLCFLITNQGGGASNPYGVSYALSYE